jgi:hypothetical protein
MGLMVIDEETKLMIKDCIKRMSKMSACESSFINSILGKRKLTDKQKEKLVSIWEKVT